MTIIKINSNEKRVYRSIAMDFHIPKAKTVLHNSFEPKSVHTDSVTFSNYNCKLQMHTDAAGSPLFPWATAPTGQRDVNWSRALAKNRHITKSILQI
ncbi:hypothetical protein EVAR_66233_1 [Eumeta japonica]|uniref:Uncharacterized protein n=1 Tax=Eumeta variegata TaxID=151549 RepID=A0A4C1ZYL7_EUMVA|nr:hypothetical protein EVAR_66233_1 [Eumeta japonica]